MALSTKDASVLALIAENPKISSETVTRLLRDLDDEGKRIGRVMRSKVQGKRPVKASNKSAGAAKALFRRAAKNGFVGGGTK